MITQQCSQLVFFRLPLKRHALFSSSRGRAGGAVVGRRRPVQPHQRGQPGCRRRRTAVHADQDAGRGRAAPGGVLHAFPPQEEQTGAARRPRRLRPPHKPGSGTERI